MWFRSSMALLLLATQIVSPCAAQPVAQAPAALDLSAYLRRSAGSQTVAGQGAKPSDKRPTNVIGSWSGNGSTPAIAYRGIVYQAPSIAPVGSGVKPASKTYMVSWQYRFLSPPPASIHAYLCNYARCVQLNSANGRTTAFAGDSGLADFSFAFFIEGKGLMTPTLQGSSSRVTVDYE